MEGARASGSKEHLPEPGSFRDPDSSVFYREGSVLRALTQNGLADWNALASTKLFSSFVARGSLIETELLETSPWGEWAGLLRHEPIPFISYPYEWPFAMLKDAALLHLELLLAALDEDLTLKDASPYNVQWRGSQPVFIDVGSFERLREGEPWAGYRQFCMLLLFPLLLQAYKDVPFQPWLRGSIDGISPQQCRNLMSLRDLVRRGVFAHVCLHSRFERRYGDRRRDVRAELRAAGFRKDLIRANAKRLDKLVRRLDWKPRRSVWSDYASTNTYTAADAERKAAFVRQAAESRRSRLVWDLGCNDGTYARIAAERSRYVVAMDADHGVVEQLYRSLEAEGNTAILPLTIDVADPSPSHGWRGSERKALAERGRPQLTLCLALLHHISITRNVPVAAFLDWLRSLETSLVIEFPTREDPMVKRLLAAKREGSHPDYERGFFERCLAEAFTVERSELVPSGTRLLYLAHPKA